MKTEVVMQRELFGMPISQKSKTEFFSATDLARAGNKWRVANDLPIFNHKAWFQQKNVKEFISELEKTEGTVKISGRGNKSHTWVHPLLFLDMALSINPKLKVEVYKWLYDSLLKYRNDSADSYKKMCGALYAHETNKDYFRKRTMLLASKIKEICKVKDWQTANEKQLKLRDSIHYNIALISNVLRDNDRAIQFGISEALKSHNESLKIV